MKQGLLLSGGIDSVALAFWLRPAFAYTIDYGQLAAAGEIRAAATVADELGINHRVIRADCSSLGSGDMAGRSQAVLAPVSEWWPFRNQLILTLAAARALEDGIAELLLGAVASDGQHIDGRPEFFRCADALFSLQEGGLRIKAPAIAMESIELVHKSRIPLSLLAWSHSCHVSPHACGTCRGCWKHAQIMKRLGRDDY